MTSAVTSPTQIDLLETFFASLKGQFERTRTIEDFNEKLASLLFIKRELAAQRAIEDTVEYIDGPKFTADLIKYLERLVTKTTLEPRAIDFAEIEAGWLAEALIMQLNKISVCAMIK